MKHDAEGAEDGSSWQDAYTQLQSALDAAQPGDEVWVAQGTYHPTSNHGMGPEEWKEGVPVERYRHFRMVNGVGIYGGFDGTETERGQRDWEENETVLSGALNYPLTGPRVYHVLHHPADYPVDETAVLDGFTISGGRANGLIFARQRGGGMRNDGASPTIRNCVFKDNYAEKSGGGMFNTNEASPFIENCEFVGNVAVGVDGAGGGAMGSYDSSSPTITGTVFRNNYGGWGGAVYNRGSSSSTIEDSAFIDNEAGLYGGGIFGYMSGSATVVNTLFSGNNAGNDGGAINHGGGTVIVVGCEFVENKAAWGGAISSSNTGARVVNSVFIGNAALGSDTQDGDGGAMHNRNTSQYGYAMPYVINSLFLGNTAAGSGGAVFSRLSSAPKLVNCTFTGNSANLRGGAVYSNIPNRTSAITNSVLWGNDAELAGQEIYVAEGTNAPNLSHNLIAGSGGSGEGWDPEIGQDFGGNIDTDPQFVDAADGDLRLQETSPAINAGDDPMRWQVASSPTHWGYLREWKRDVAEADLDGNPRISGEAVDMGAYELPVSVWTLAILASEVGGNTEPAPGDHEIPVGESGQVEAVPADGWALGHWILDDEEAGDANPITVDSAGAGGTRTLQAVFVREPQHWTLDILRPHGEGTTDPALGGHHHEAGQDAGVRADPEDGWAFAHWLLDGEEEYDNPVTVEAAAAGETRTIQAVFVAEDQPWTLDIRRPLGEGTTEPPIGEHEHDAGEHASVEALPVAGWHLDHWLLDGEDAGAANPISVEPHPQGGARTLQPVFLPAPDSWTLEILPPDGGGRTAPATGEHEIPAGESADATALPGSGWDFDHWLLDNEPTGDANPISVEPAPDGETRTLQAVFTDTAPPTARILTPRPDRIHVPSDTKVVVEIADAGSGVNLEAVTIEVDGEKVVGREAPPESGLWLVRHSGDRNESRFHMFRRRPFTRGHKATVGVEASDNAGNTMDRKEFSFHIAVRPFAPPVQLNSQPGVTGRPAAARGPDGELLAAWEQEGPDGPRIWTSSLYPQPEHWSRPAPVHPEGGGQRNPAAAFTDDGAAFVLWEGEGDRPGIYSAQSLDGGQSWSAPQRLNEDAEEPSEATSPAFIGAGGGGGAGKAIVAWQERREGGAWDIFVARFEEGAWNSENITDNPDVDQIEPALAGDGENVHVVWTHVPRNPGATDIWAASSGRDRDWELYPVVTDADSNQRAPALVPVDWGALGELFPTRYVIAWEDDRNGTQDVFFFPNETLFPGTTFSEEPPFAPAWETLFPNFPNEAIVEAAINIVSDDAPDWRAADQTAPSLFVHVEAPPIDGPAPLGGVMNGQVWPDPDQWAQVYVTWQDWRSGEDDPDVRFAEKSGADAAFGLDALVAPSAAAQGPPVLVAGDHGEPIVFWAESGSLFCCAGKHIPSTGATVPVDQGIGGEGTFDTDRGRLRVKVPQDAVDVDVEITVSEVVAPPPLPRGGIGVPFSFGPSGQRFREAITVELPVDPEEMDGLTGPWRVYWYNEDLGDWDPNYFEAEYYPEEGHIRFFPTHFTMFGAAGSSVEHDDAHTRRRSSGGCSMSGSGPGDLTLLVLPWALAALLLCKKLAGAKRGARG